MAQFLTRAAAPTFAGPSSSSYAEIQRYLSSYGSRYLSSASWTSSPSPRPGGTVASHEAPKGDAALAVEKGTECVVGVRTWALSQTYPRGYRLCSYSTSWEPCKRMEAVCHSSAKTCPDPAGKCFCGINAYSGEVPITKPDTVTIAGEVNLWGRVVVFEGGYRAQYAYPKRLCVIGADDLECGRHIANDLETAYQVPCDVWA